jgi:hypothetical protein
VRAGLSLQKITLSKKYDNNNNNNNNNHTTMAPSLHTNKSRAREQGATSLSLRDAMLLTMQAVAGDAGAASTDCTTRD